MKSEITKKQFVFSSESLDLPGLELFKIGDSFLYVDKNLQLKSFTVSGEQVVMLGYAYTMNTLGTSVESEIQNAGSFLNIPFRFWTGKWVLISESEIINDPTGLMPLFYYNDKSKWIISSSLAMISAIIEKGACCRLDINGIGWRLLPETLIDGVKQLFPLQKIEYSNHELTIQNYCWIKDYRDLSTKEKCKRISLLLTTGLRNIERHSNRKIVLALTGGKDSRVVFSALINSGVKFSVYTAEHDHITTADRRIPAQLAKEYNIEYRYIKRGKRNNQKEADYLAFSFGNSQGEDMRFYAYGQLGQLPNDAIIIRSGLFEAGQSYGRSIAGKDKDSFMKGMESYYPELKNDSIQRKAFNTWMKYVNDTDIDYLDIRDRFYIEQRVGGWASAIEQSLDMNDFNSIQIANCAELLSILLSATEKERKDLALSFETIKILDGKLLKYPVNQRTIEDRIRYCFSIARHPVKKVKNYIAKRKRK